ncbi:multicopper oxidase domain-containing protein [Gluconacetobacter azotocaptans]|uniref:multicopper oxidase family protein n=1 Tax=Gluconacetobacter azotocaptans TaxID=142834 RepID=UPI0019565168|nr:multicopper oxidase domain-containing protein [Gluconacetobacter azotocaptans]MBM9400771.1 multicopper oxidase domain-containing protein [Gluconacetobacter azotocaptans]
MTLGRRSLLKLAGSTTLTATVPGWAWGAGPAPGENSDHTLRIATGLVELAPDRIISTMLYNGQFPGPLLRLTEGTRVIVDIFNDTDTPELVHWHGQMIPSAVDGAAEEGTPTIPPHGMRRIAFVPRPSGFRFYHTHVAAGGDLNRGTYTGQVGPLYIEPKDNPGAYDREIFLVLKEFEPSFSRGGDMAMAALAGDPVAELVQMGKAADAAAREKTKGFEVGYESFGINGKMLGHGEPIRVKQGERVLFHVLNGSAGEIRSLALPGHVFRVVALDGNPVPMQAEVPVLWLGTAERISAIVRMDHPGIWVMGDLADDDRRRGMGIVVAYERQSGKPLWIEPKPARWDYARFGRPQSAIAPDETIEMTIVKHNAALNGFNQWTLNGEAFSMETMRPRYTLHRGRRYRFRIRNASDDIHPLHLHRHSFELTRIGGKPTGGVIKDVVMLGGFQELEFDFVADNPGPTLFHCHQQLHMDFGFMALFDYA